MRDLGAPRVATTGNLKLDVPAPPADPDKLRALRDADRRASGDRRGLDPSGRRDRDDRCAPPACAHLPRSADDHRAAPSRARPGHRRDRQGRGPDVRAALARRTAGTQTEIYIADTMGELGLIYRVAPIVFMGGSLVDPRRAESDRGGQARRGHPARSACLEFRRDLCGARRRRRRRAGDRRRQARGARRRAAARTQRRGRAKAAARPRCRRRPAGRRARPDLGGARTLSDADAGLRAPREGDA